MKRIILASLPLIPAMVASMQDAKPTEPAPVQLSLEP
jgi:hypothetical protein